MRSICLGLAILIGSVFGACAQNTPQVGGQGGGPFDDACRGTDVLIGWNSTQGSSINTVAAVCQAQNTGVLVGTIYGLTTHGHEPENTGGGLSPAFGAAPLGLRCPAGQAVYGMTIWVNKFHELDAIRATCVSLLPGGGAQSQIGIPSKDPNGVTESAIGCGSGVAVGITGRSGALMDSLGLKCKEDFPWHVAAAPTTPTNPTTPPQQFVTVLLDDDVYNSVDFSDANKIQNLTLRAGTPNVVLIEADASGTRFHLHWKECDAILPTGCWAYSGPGDQALKLP